MANKDQNNLAKGEIAPHLYSPGGSKVTGPHKCPCETTSKCIKWFKQGHEFDIKMTDYIMKNV